MNEIRIGHTYRPATAMPTSSHPTYHSHQNDEMLVVHSGDIIAMTPNTYLAHKGPCVLFYKTGRLHAQINGSGTPYDRYCISFERNTIIDFFPDFSLFTSFLHEDAFLLPITDAEEERLTAAAKLLYDCSKTNGSDIRLKLLLTYIFAEVTEIARQSKGSQPVHFYLTSVAQFIAEHIGEKLTIERITDEFHISRAKLIRDFREFFSMSVLQYITMERLTRAKLMLRQGETVFLTAEKCGFADSAYFIKVFSKYIGITPAAYRKQCCQNAMGDD